MNKILDLTELVERSSSLEQNFGISLNSIYACLENDDNDLTMTITGEIISTIGQKLNTSINLKCSIFDSKNRIIAVENLYFYNDSFLEIDNFEFNILKLKSADITKIKIFPTTC